jgi:hypothetical protein
MRVATLTTFDVDKKEPLGQLIQRIRQAFLDAGMAEPTIRFTLRGSSRSKGASAIDRVVKNYPEMERFLVLRPSLPGAPDVRMLSNSETGEAAAYATLQAIAAGIPRTYPFRSVVLHWYAAPFGERLIGLPKAGHSFPGVLLTDNYFITGHARSLAVYTVVEADVRDKKLPPNPEPVNAVMKACGKVTRTELVPIQGPDGAMVPSISPANAAAVKAIVADYRARLKEIVERAGLPHNLPSAAEIQNPEGTAGPRKPALQTAFKPMGYACTGGSGQLHATRRTADNLTVELLLDVGTWSQEVSSMFLVQGAGFRESLPLPIAPHAAPGAQYPIGDAAQWQKIVENLAAMVRELDRTFVPAIEQAAGPTPAWYQPAS